MSDLKTKLVGGLISAFGEHLIERNPELGALAHAFGYTTALPPSRAIAHAESKVRSILRELSEAAEIGSRAASAHIQKKVRAKQAETAQRRMERKLKTLLESLTPRERKIVEERLRGEAEEPEAPQRGRGRNGEEVVDLKRNADGTWSPA